MPKILAILISHAYTTLQFCTIEVFNNDLEEVSEIFELISYAKYYFIICIIKPIQIVMVLVLNQ